MGPEASVVNQKSTHDSRLLVHDTGSLFSVACLPPVSVAFCDGHRGQDLEPLPLAFTRGTGFSSSFSRASSPVRVFRHERDLLKVSFDSYNGANKIISCLLPFPAAL